MSEIRRYKVLSRDEIETLPTYCDWTDETYYRVMATLLAPYAVATAAIGEEQPPPGVAEVEALYRQQQVALGATWQEQMADLASRVEALESRMNVHADNLLAEHGQLASQTERVDRVVALMKVWSADVDEGYPTPPTKLVAALRALLAAETAEPQAKETGE